MQINDQNNTVKPTQTAAPTQQLAPAPAPAIPVSTLDALLQIMLQREARQANEEQRKLDAAAQKAKVRQANAESNFEDDKSRQAVCRHLKGGKHRRKNQPKDYAVYLFRYINGENVIRCQLCNSKWKEKDTVESLVRFGKKIPNHTKIGWAEACEMVAESTNTAGSSEIPVQPQVPVGRNFEQEA